MSRTLAAFTSLLVLAFACAAPAQTPSPSSTPAAQNVRISFLPPPLEGTISVGVYDAGGKLVRILHREAAVSDFEIGADALHTQWAGKEESGEPLPPGKYHARGYMVGDLQVEELPAANGPVPVATAITVKLMANPLVGAKRPSVALAAGFDEDGTFLQTVDGLPLFTVDELSGVFSVAISQRSDKSLDFFQTDGDTVDHLHITGVEKMMAFDAGEFDLK